MSGGDLMTEGKAFGHTGYTGVSIWVDAERDLTVAFFTNRVHPSRENTKISLVRPIVHNAILSCV